MTQAEAQSVLDKIVGQIFGYKNPFTLDQFMQKYAFDVRLPSQVNDTTTGGATWAQSINPTKFITMDNAHFRSKGTDWMLPKRPIKGIDDIIAAWNEVNYVVTERQLDSMDVHESDNIYGSQKVYRSQDIHASKNILFSDGIISSEFIAASQRSNSSVYCARLEDSKECSTCFSVSWSAKVANSIFIHDSYDIYECIFCSHVTSKKFCIANMQFDEAEYKKYKKMIIDWIFSQ